MSDLELFDEAEDLTDCPTVVIHPDGSREYLNMTAEAIVEELLDLPEPTVPWDETDFLYEKIFHGPTSRGGYDRGPVTFMRDDPVPEASVDEAARLRRNAERASNAASWRAPSDPLADFRRALLGDVSDIFGNGL